MKSELAVDLAYGVILFDSERPLRVVVSPQAKTRIEVGDVLIAKGTRAGAERLQSVAGQGPD